MLEHDPNERAAFDAALALHLLLAFPDAAQEWIEYDRRLLLAFPDGVTCSLWEPNFYFALGDHYDQATLLAQAAAHIHRSHSATLTRIAETETGES